MSYAPISDSSVEEQTLHGSPGPQPYTNRGSPDGSTPAARVDKDPLASGWPTTARTLRRDSFLSMWLPLCAWDTITALLPIGFIVLGILALHLDGKPISPHGERVVEATRLGPTIYPIVFAALVARFFHSLARWTAERPRGIRLAALEQIYGSQSFAGTIERVLFLRTNTIVAVATLLVWAMSPLGGQSSSRLVSRVSESEIDSATVYYTDIRKPMSSAIGASALDDTRSLIHNIYTSSLMSPILQRRGPLDMWERPKIPKWNGSRGGEAGDEWIDVDDQASSVDGYSSLLGINIHALEYNNNTKYDIFVNSTYIDLDCEAVAFGILFNKSEEYFPANVLNVTSMEYEYDGSNGPLGSRTPNGYTSFRAGPDYPRNVNRTGKPGFEPPALLYASKNRYHESYGLGYSTGFALFNCTMTPVAVETSIRCGPLARTGCAALRQRLLPSNGPSHELWPENMVDTALFNTLREWPFAQGGFDIYTASPTDNYLAGDDNLFLSQELRQWNDTDMGTFSQRVTTAFNTMWQATINPRNATTPDLMASQQGALDYETAPTEARVAIEREIYRASRPWIIVLFVATLILQALAVAGVVLDKLVVRAPDIMGYVSSSTRDNGFFPLPMAGSTLGGAERARLLGDVRVRIADVRPREDVGYIAFERAMSGVPWVPLDRRREYL